MSETTKRRRRDEESIRRMGRPSSASCFKIMACGNSDSVDRDDLQAPEGSSDRRGWSFRKRSARHRVLSNSVTFETPSANKASPDSATVSFQTQPSSTALEKNSVVQCTEEKTELSAPVESKVSELAAPVDSKVSEPTVPVDITVPERPVPVDITVPEHPVPVGSSVLEPSVPLDSKVSEPRCPVANDGTANIAPDESVVIIIQSAIRGFLARRMLLKHKNIIKLQAAVRGHIVRKHAVGSLRCVQAIVKMQALVRQRRARLLLEELRTKKEGKLDEKNGQENHGSTHLAKDNSENKPHVTYTSIKKLLSNRFARQLLESKPRTKTINIKCDPSKSDSAWKWLERWMSVSSMGNQQSPQFETPTEHQEEKKLEKLDCHLENEISSQDNIESRDIKSRTEVSAAPSEGDENTMTYVVDNFDSDASRETFSLERQSTEKPSQNIGESTDDTLNFLPGKEREADGVSKMEPDLFLHEPEVENEQHIHHVKMPAPEVPETDGKKNLFLPRKATNPAFIAAQSKFEELTSTANSARSVGSSDQDSCVDYSTEVSLTREIVPAVNSFPHTTGVEGGGSECGTELSISSTLDSPDRPEVGVFNDVKETLNIEDGANNHKSSLNLDVDTEVESQVQERDLSFSNSVEQEKHEYTASVECENDRSAKLLDSNSSRIDQKPDTNETGVQMQPESEISHHVSKASPEASPRSYVTGPESQETPSSQVSMKTKKSSGGKGGSNNKRKSESYGKGHHSPSGPNNNSGARNSSEQLPEDHKTGKRRNSFGSTKADHSDHEPRDSSSSLPSYMQATESARAKALANSSPRSSPDVQDKDFYIKKRHSLPGTGTNMRQESPRVQKSAQAQQGAKGNVIHSPQVRKWRR